MNKAARSSSVLYNEIPFGSVAQLVEQEPLKLLVAGSSPARPTIFCMSSLAKSTEQMVIAVLANGPKTEPELIRGVEQQAEEYIRRITILGRRLLRYLMVEKDGTLQDVIGRLEKRGLIQREEERFKDESDHEDARTYVTKRTYHLVRQTREEVDATNAVAL